MSKNLFISNILPQCFIDSGAMAECLDDLNLPQTVIARLIKESLPQGANVTSEAKSAIARAASVFVLYMTNMSNSIARRNNRKRILPKDIFDTLKDIDFVQFMQPLQHSFQKYKETHESKKGNSSQHQAEHQNDMDSSDTKNDIEDEEENVFIEKTSLN